MIDLHDVRNRPDEYQKACNNKGIKFQIKDFVELDARFRALKTEVEALRSQQNNFSKELPKLQGDQKAARLSEMKDLSAKLKDSSDALKVLEEQWNVGQYRIPSIPLDQVPVGKDDSENREIRTVGQAPKFSFPIRDHVELGRQLDILDIERGVKIAGARSYFLKGDGARLQNAIMNYSMDFIQDRGFLLFEPPHIVKYSAMLGTGYFPGGEESAYHLDERDSEYHLIGTSEVSVCAYHEDEILDESKLPLRYAGYSPCYRREAGTYGKDTQGIYRVHQFYKVEQVVICKNDLNESAQIHAELLKNAEDFLQSLGLCYRVVDVCTGDMGQGQVFKNDIETWMPSRKSFSETHSCSTFYEYQARRLKIRYKNSEGKNVLCHTLNNTLAASARLIIAVLENNQCEDGTVNIPPALRPYMRGQEKIVKRG